MFVNLVDFFNLSSLFILFTENSLIYNRYQELSGMEYLERYFCVRVLWSWFRNWYLFSPLCLSGVVF